jgi:hypothetical protein
MPAFRRHTAGEPAAPRLAQLANSPGDHSRVDQLVQALHRSSNTRENGIDRAMLTSMSSSGSGDTVPVNASSSGASRPNRLGENYRRKASRAMANPAGAFRR